MSFVRKPDGMSCSQTLEDQVPSSLFIGAYDTVLLYSAINNGERQRTVSAILPILIERTFALAPAAKPSVRGVISSVVTCTVAVFVVTSVAEGVGTVPLPMFLEASMAMVPGFFRTHILACCIGVVTGTAALSAALSGRPHRTMGRAALALLLIGGIASVPVALVGSSSPLAKAAFLGQAATLVVAIVVGWQAGLDGRAKLHRDCMACVGLALSGAPLSRLALKVPDVWLGPEASYAAVAWLSWLAPFGVALCVRLARRREAIGIEGAK